MAYEQEKYFPFDSEEIEGEYDREYSAEDWARYFTAFISSGIFMKQSTNLQVMANGDMSVTIKPGSLIIDGVRYDNLEDIVLTLDSADGILNRIDRITIVYDKEKRDIHCEILKGELSQEPVPAAVRRTEEYRDYIVADIYVAAGSISIKQEKITDQRLNSEVCGLAVPFTEINTSEIFEQLQDWYQRIKTNGEKDIESFTTQFKNWFTTTKATGDKNIKDFSEQYTSWFNQMQATGNTNMENFTNTFQNWFATTKTTGDKNIEDFSNQYSNWFNQMQATGNTNMKNFTNTFQNWFATTKENGENDVEELLKKLDNLIENNPTGALQIQIDECKEKENELQTQIDECKENENELQTQIDSAEEKIESIESGLYNTVSENLINKDNYAGKTEGGIKWIVNDDKTVSATGTPTWTVSFTVNNSVTVKKGKYFLKCCPEGGSKSTYYVLVQSWNPNKPGNADTTIGYDTGEGIVIEVTEEVLVLRIYLRIGMGVAVNNLTFKPILTKGSAAKDYEQSFEHLLGKNVVDNLLSTSSKLPLSAAQGKKLSEQMSKQLNGLNLYAMSESEFAKTTEDTANGLYFIYED